MIFFVTGGSRGIGTAIVLEAIRQGHDVAFTYLTQEAKALDVIAQANAIRPDARCKAYRLDVASSHEVESVAEAVLADFETVEVIVNNAGLTRDNLLVSMSDQEWADVIAANLTGPFYVTRQFLPTLLSQRFGRVIMLSSLVSDGGSGQANYAAAKSGLHGLTKTIAKEYGKKGITANAIVAGFFETDMTKAGMPPHLRDFWKTYCPVPKGRTGDLSEIASLVCYLASKEAAFINGQILRITGGLDWSP